MVTIYPLMEIPLGGKRANGAKAIIWAGDTELVLQYKWFMNNDGYAQANIPLKFRLENGPKHILMHRLIIQATGITIPERMMVDHKDRDRINNDRRNLRVVTRQLNNININPRKRNKTGILGVHYVEAMGRYQAQIRRDGKVYHIGFYDSPYEAGEAYERTRQEWEAHTKKR